MTRYLIDLLEQNGSFPKRMLVGRRNVYWSEAEVLDFVNQTKSKRPVGSATPDEPTGDVP
jgi:predicted DNA-binding transcriptional regulator AlpA